MKHSRIKIWAQNAIYKIHGKMAGDYVRSKSMTDPLPEEILKRRDATNERRIERIRKRFGVVT